jgi:hypothetical protein
VSVVETEMRWWKSFLTPQNIIAIIFAVFTAGGYWQETKYQKLRNDQQDDRMERIEKRLSEDRADSDRLYMRKDYLDAELRAIRLQIEGLRRDLR